MNKWGKQYWKDLAERVGFTLVTAFITALTLTGTTPMDWTDTQAVWTVIGLPTLLVALKGLAANLGTGPPSASVVDVSSNPA